MKIGNKDFEIGKRTYIMGILNVTPDSFSDGGNYTTIEKAVLHAEEMIEEGADIIDVGGESTRPGHERITDLEEISRVVPVILALKERFPDVPVSIDTYKSAVCKEALEAGADLINDIWGFKYDKKMAELSAEYKLPVCLMHNRNNTDYRDILREFTEDLSKSISIAKSCGVQDKQIILDPGIGFGKTYEQNLFIMNHLDEMKKRLPYPVLLGTSRKSMIGKALGDIPAKERLAGTITTTAVGIMKGCDFVRVHDVGENKKACLMADAIVRKQGGDMRHG